MSLQRHHPAYASARRRRRRPDTGPEDAPTWRETIARLPRYSWPECRLPRRRPATTCSWLPPDPAAYAAASPVSHIVAGAPSHITACAAYDRRMLTILPGASSSAAQDGRESSAASATPISISGLLATA